MMRRALSIAFMLALGLRADSAQEVHDLVADAAHGLDDRKAAVFEAAFDGSMAGLAKLRGNVDALLKTSDTRSTIEIVKDEGDDQTRKVQLDWRLEITERGGAGAVTQRRAQVQCEVRKKAGGWRIVAFTPADFFTPPQVEEAWNVLAEAALGLTETVTDTASNDGGIPAANARKFMEAIDPAMAGYAQLRDNVLAMEQGADVESGVDIVKNEGDDKVRSIDVDWSLNLLSHETGVTAVQRRQVVTCRLEKQGKKWRITSLEPREFFGPVVRGK